MAKFKHRVKSKGKKWKKGSSSSSNPSTTKYRDRARSFFFQENVGSESLLTTFALKQHDSLIDSGKKPKPMDEDVDDEVVSLTASTCRTTDTFATDFSGCTNVSYSKLLNSFDPSSAIQKEKLAVLAAISEVIKSNGGTENNTEYFGALMTMLENTECEEMSVAAVLSLLAMGIKSVPQAVLTQKFSQCCKILIDVLAKHAESNNNNIYRGALACLSVLLRNQPYHVWKDSSTIKVFDTVLMFTTHSKPKVRKAAQNAVCGVLRASAFMLSQQQQQQQSNGDGTGLSAHPGAAAAADFCCRQIEQNGALNTSITSTLHVLGLLKDIMCTFPKKQLKLACETVLKVMSLGNVVVTSCGLQALHGLFSAAAAPAAAVGGLTAELNGQLVNALYSFLPPASNWQHTQAWLAVMQQAHAAWARSNLQQCMQQLPQLVCTCTALWLTARPDVMNAATLTIKACLEDCVGPAAAATLVDDKPFVTIVGLFRTTLSYEYHAVWAHVLHLWGVLFKACGKRCTEALLPCLRELAALRDSAVFAYMNELDYCLGMAVRSLGPELVLKAIPLKFTGKNIDNEFKRSWLLPVLRENIQSTTLKCFIDNFLPIAIECRNKSEELKTANENKSSAVSYDLLQSQIWSLLPSFCAHATDIAESFSRIAKALGSILGSRKDLRLSVMAALRKLISSVQETNNASDAKEIGKYAKNYLPILFNIYTTPAQGSEEAGIRLASLETIKVYLTLADARLCKEMFDKAMTKLGESGGEAFVKESVLDLVRTLLPHQSVQSIDALYNSTVANMQQVTDHKQQKKYFRCLEEICRSESEGCTSFLAARFNEVNQLLLSSLSSTSPSSRGPRLRCLLYLLQRQQLASNDLDKLIGETVAEAVVCCLDINSSCRSTAYDVINQMADRSLQAGTFEKYLETVLAGLASSPRVISATLLALASITYHCRQAIAEDVLNCVLNNVLLLVCSSTREIVRSALSYVKLYTTSFGQQAIATHVAPIVKALANMTDDCKRHFRLKTRDILSRLVRWYGADSIMCLIPASDTVMVARVRNLRKLESRKKKSRQQELDEDGGKHKADDLEFFVNKKPKSIDEILAESESDDDDFDDAATRKQNRASAAAAAKKAPKAWIQESADSFMDFTSSDANRKITTSKPAAADAPAAMMASKVKKGVDKNRGFKTAPDGRLIIKDDDDDEDDEGGAERRRRFTIPAMDSDDDDSDGDAKSMLSVGKSSRKRKMSGSTDGGGVPPLKYQAGGSGIHRPIRAADEQQTKRSKQKSKEAGAEYRSKKAKGDVKRKGLPDPYAYLPLQRSALNRRKKMKAAGQFRSIVSGARKGAKRGASAKRIKIGK